MIKNQTSIRAGIEDFLCPFTDMYITQGSNGQYSHQGTCANDVRGKERGVRYPYYAPCTCKCLKTYSQSGQAMWQSINPVRFANGRVDYATFMTAHDDSLDVQVGQVVPQGHQLGNMGTKGNATGVHCHIQISQSADTSWYKNKYGIYQFNNEYDPDYCYFIDNTVVLYGMGGDWKITSDVKVESENYVCLGNMYVRWGPGLNYGIKLVKDLTADGREHATSQNPYAYGVYKAGTVFTCKEEINNEYGKWALTPSGYVCIIGASGNEYCRKC